MCVKLDNYVFLENVHENRQNDKNDCPDSIFIIRTVSGLSGQFQDYPDSLWIIWTVFIDYTDSLWIVWKVSRLSRQTLDYPDSFLTIQTISLPSGQF